MIKGLALQYRGQTFKAKKVFTQGTHRTRAPSETFELIRPFFKRIGLTRLADITGLDRIGIPVVISIRPNATLLAVDSGKGVTLEAAKVSAAMECIERYHNDATQLESLFDSYNNLKKRFQVMPLEGLQLTKHHIFNPNSSEHWVCGWDIVNQEEVVVPRELVVTPNVYTNPSLFSFQLGTNGLASGNTFIEAVCAGLYEVVERDGLACHRVASWRDTNYTYPRIRQETIVYPTVLELLDKLEESGIGAVIHHAAVDTQVPIYQVIIYDKIVHKMGVYKGFGAHLDPEIAMCRAITEAVQARAVFIAGSRDDFFHQEYKTNKLADDDESYLDLLSKGESMGAGEVPNRTTGTFEEDLAQIIHYLKQVGLNQVIVFDLTKDDFPISVVRVVVPGLEGYLFGYYRPGYRANNFARRIIK